MIKTIFLLALCLSLAHTRILQNSSILDAIESVYQAVSKKIMLTKEVDYSFDYHTSASNSTGVDYAPFLFGTHEGRSSEGIPVKLHVDTSLNGIALASGVLAGTAKTSWGIDCSPGNKSNCTYVTSQTPSQDSFTNANCPAELKSYSIISGMDLAAPVPYWTADTVTCRAGVTFMRWTNSSLPDGTTAEQLAANLPVTLFEINPVIGVNAGYLGLSPVSEFFKYVVDSTDWDSKTEVLFGLSLTPNSGAAKLVDDRNKDYWKQNQLVIHGKRNGGSVSFYAPLITGATSWTVAGANFTLSKDEYPEYVPATNQKICLSTKYPYMVGFTSQSVSDLLTTYFKKVCVDPTKPDSCPSSSAKKDSIKKVQIGFTNGATTDEKTYQITMDTDDFLWFNDEKFTSLIGNKVDPLEWGCDQSADMVVGRAFLSRYEAVMQISKTQKSLAFVSNEGTSSIFLIILIILGCIILAICIAIILLKVCKRKTEDGANYESRND